ncbi:phosphoribosylglycinamide formyltransferase [Anaerocaecibacter muris]|uniref:phosphoribosylglycinamide formyltransferase n=1 Tax=Anaerocaecibacter muris TaxID=2941513 RepID=UPI003F68CD3D
MKNIAVMFSGNGTDFQALIDGQKNGAFDGRIVVAIASNDRAFGIERARQAGIDCYVCAKYAYRTEEARDTAVREICVRYGVDLIVLAGYLGILTDPLLDWYAGKIINIHPALLPKFGGKGMYGLNVHKAVIEAGEKVSGATVHYSVKEIDAGAIILQRSLEVLPDDTPESLQKRILEQIEHPLLVEAVAMLCAQEDEPVVEEDEE